MKKLLEVLKPVLVKLLTSVEARQLLVDVLKSLAEKSDNEVDNELVAALARALRVEE
jgi:hypothetical protein